MGHTEKELITEAFRLMFATSSVEGKTGAQSRVDTDTIFSQEKLIVPKET